MSPELSQLIELQELDVELQKIAERLSMIPAERDQIESEFRQYAGEFLALKSRQEEILNHRKQLDIELATTQQHHEKYTQDKMRVRNEKEYAAALREIDTAKRQISALETEILKEMEELEKLEGELKVYAPDVDSKRAETDESLGALDSERDEAHREMQACAERRERLGKKIPKDLLATYDRVARIRRGQALAEVRNDICTACRMRIRPQLVSDVRRGDRLITCDSCSRILYYKHEPLQSAEMAINQ